MDATEARDDAEPAAADELRLDGNAAGGLLAELFAFEVTTAHTVCAGCGAGRPVGALLVYAHGMGTIIRCPSCDHALIRVGHGRTGLWLDLRGLAVLRPAPDAPNAAGAIGGRSGPPG
jgi:hypothetical protein